MHIKNSVKSTRNFWTIIIVRTNTWSTVCLKLTMNRKQKHKKVKKIMNRMNTKKIIKKRNKTKIKISSNMKKTMINNSHKKILNSFKRLSDLLSIREKSIPNIRHTLDFLLNFLLVDKMIIMILTPFKKVKTLMILYHQRISNLSQLMLN